MNILIYAPFISRSRDTESFIYKLQELGHKVTFLNLQHSEQLANNLIARGVGYERTKLSPGNKRSLFRNFLFLIAYCRKNNIDLVFSHLDPANIISVFAQFFLKTQFYIIRHHADDALLNGTHKSLFNKVLYRLSRRIIVVSNLAREVMIRDESVNPEKIGVIPPLYDFSQFEKADTRKVHELKKRFPQALKILFAGRLVRNKRPEVLIEVAGMLKRSGIDFVIMILGQGPLEDQLKAGVKHHDLEKECVFIGYSREIMPFITACDILLHPSISESSSLIVKECGMNEKAVLVCRGVGDFDELIEHGVNGMLLNKESFAKEASDFLLRHYQDKRKLQSMGKALKDSIIKKHSIEDKFYLYDPYLKKHG